MVTHPFSKFYNYYSKDRFEFLGWDTEASNLLVHIT